MSVAVDTKRLSEAQIEQFQCDGFFIARGAFDAATMARIEAWTDEVQNWPETPGRHMMYFEPSLKEPGKRVLNRLENFYPYHESFAALFESDEIQGVASQLLGEPAVLFKDKINFKMPGGDGFRGHQDQQAGWGTYAPYFVTAMVSIDAATMENGCLELIAGRHRDGIIGKEWEPLTDADLDGIHFVPYPTDPGDVVFFDSFAPHRSAPNMTDAARRVLYVTYNAAAHGNHREQYYADKRLSYPPDIERDPDKEYRFRV